MSRYNSPSVMISATLPSAPVRSNLRPLQEAIIHWGKSYISLTMLHFHHNSSHSLPANSYLLQTIRVYRSWLPTQHLASQTHSALCTVWDTLAGKCTRTTMNETESQSDWLEVYLYMLPQGGRYCNLWVSSVFCQFLWLKVNQICEWNMTDAVRGDSFGNVHGQGCLFAFKNDGK